MTTGQRRLFGSKSTPPGPRVREVGRLRAHLEATEALEPWTVAALGAALDAARELDRQRTDPDHSGHTIAMLTRAYGEALDRVRPPAAGLTAGPDPFMELLAQLDDD